MDLADYANPLQLDILLTLGKRLRCFERNMVGPVVRDGRRVTLFERTGKKEGRACEQAASQRDRGH